MGGDGEGGGRGRGMGKGRDQGYSKTDKVNQMWDFSLVIIIPIIEAIRQPRTQPKNACVSVFLSIHYMHQ